MDKFASLKAFTKVVENGGFAAAARDLGLSRSQVNKLVINLEESLGVQLLNRTTRSVSSNPAGQAFYERARAILNDLTEAESALQDDQADPQGTLKINAPMSFGTLHLAPALNDFMVEHPKLRIQLELNDSFIDPLTDNFDITVRIAEPAEPLALIDHRIVEIKRVLCASPDFLKRRGTPKSPRELSNLPCLHYGNLPTGNIWRLTGPDGTRDIRVNGVLCSNNAEVLRDAAVKGLGIALLPTFVAGADLQNGQLVSIMTEHKAPHIHLCLFYAPHRHLAARVRFLVNFIYNRFGNKPYWDLVS